MFLKSVAELRAALQAREISSEELTRHFLDRIHRQADQLNCMVTVTEERALEQARAADRLLSTRKTGPLTGVPMVHKDLFCTKGVKTSCGSRMLDNFIAPYDATVVQLVQQAGMVMQGEFDMTIGGETRRLKVGDSYVIPGGVEHSVDCLEGWALALDIFSPPREEYK